MKVKMEDMAQEFGDMLKETLDRMRERIEVHVLCMFFVLVPPNTVGTADAKKPRTFPMYVVTQPLHHQVAQARWLRVLSLDV